jgi:hypothetical protein
MREELAEYVDHLAQDYLARYASRGETPCLISQRMSSEFIDGLTTNKGRKYIKVMTQNFVHSFIVNTDKDPKFAKGDILMAASRNAPARNFARGNVYVGSFDRVRWSGVV